MRLTEKSELGFIEREPLKYTAKEPIYLDYEKTKIETIENILNKLGQLEDIEEELGIDLITLSKILKNGCYVKPWKKVWFSKVMTLQTNEFGILKLFDFNDNDYSLRNYGIDFALTREELADGK